MFARAVEEDQPKVDLILVMGTSLKVAPVSELLTFMPNVPRILINKTPVTHTTLDVMLLGDSDEIVQYLCDKLEWSLPPPDPVSSVVGKESEAAELKHEVEEGAETEAGAAAAGPLSTTHDPDADGRPPIDEKGNKGTTEILEPEPVADYEWVWQWPSAQLEDFRYLRSVESRDSTPGSSEEGQALAEDCAKEDMRERLLEEERPLITESESKGIEDNADDE